MLDASLASFLFQQLPVMGQIVQLYTWASFRPLLYLITIRKVAANSHGRVFVSCVASLLKQGDGTTCTMSCWVCLGGPHREQGCP